MLVNRYYWWFTNPIPNHLRYIKPCKSWDKLPTSTVFFRISESTEGTFQAPNRLLCRKGPGPLGQTLQGKPNRQHLPLKCKYTSSTKRIMRIQQFHCFNGSIQWYQRRKAFSFLKTRSIRSIWHQNIIHQALKASKQLSAVQTTSTTYSLRHFSQTNQVGFRKVQNQKAFLPKVPKPPANEFLLHKMSSECCIWSNFASMTSTPSPPEDPTLLQLISGHWQHRQHHRQRCWASYVAWVPSKDPRNFPSARFDCKHSPLWNNWNYQVHISIATYLALNQWLGSNVTHARRLWPQNLVQLPALQIPKFHLSISKPFATDVQCCKQQCHCSLQWNSVGCFVAPLDTSRTMLTSTSDGKHW